MDNIAIASLEMGVDISHYQKSSHAEGEKPVAY